MEPGNENKIAELEEKIDAIQASVNQIKKYMQLTFWITVIVFVLPLLALAIVVPKVISFYTGMLGGI